MPEQPLNVSSLVVKVDPRLVEETVSMLRASDLCEVYFHDASGKIIVTIEGENAGDEMRKMKEIQNLPHILSADLAYTYCEDELAEARENFVDKADVVPKRLQEPR